jgi:hypothetical protein
MQEGDRFKIPTTVVGVDEDTGAVTFEVEDGNDESHHRITLTAEQIDIITKSK